MEKLSSIFAATALALAFGAPAFAETASAGMANLETAGKLVGASVYNDQGESVGSVLNVLAFNQAGEPTAILSLSQNVSRGTQLVAVPVRNIRLDYRANAEVAGKSAVSGTPGNDFNWLAGGGG